MVYLFFAGFVSFTLVRLPGAVAPLVVALVASCIVAGTLVTKLASIAFSADLTVSDCLKCQMLTQMAAGISALTIMTTAPAALFAIIPAALLLSTIGISLAVSARPVTAVTLAIINFGAVFLSLKLFPTGGVTHLLTTGVR